MGLQGSPYTLSGSRSIQQPLGYASPIEDILNRPDESLASVAERTALGLVETHGCPLIVPHRLVAEGHMFAVGGSKRTRSRQHCLLCLDQSRWQHPCTGCTLDSASTLGIRGQPFLLERLRAGHRPNNLRSPRQSFTTGGNSALRLLSGQQAPA